MCSQNREVFTIPFNTPPFDANKACRAISSPSMRIKDMKLYFFAILMALAPARALAYDFCLTRHLHDAIQVNSKRAPIYETMSQGESNSISEALISYEQDKLWVSWLADLWPSLRHGSMEPLCLSLVDMSKTPEMSMVPTAGFEIWTYDAPNVLQIQKDLLPLLEQNNFFEIILESTQILEKLSTNKQSNCLVRHFLESIRRASGVVLSLGVNHFQVFDKTRILKLFIRHEIADLTKANQIDLMAVPLQARGIPIICQDVPDTPPFNNDSQTL